MDKLIKDTIQCNLKTASILELSELCDLLSMELLYRAEHRAYPAECFIYDGLIDQARYASYMTIGLRNVQRAIDDVKEG